FGKCQVQPVLLTADEEHTLNEFHRRQFVGDHRKRRSLLRASTTASNSVSPLTRLARLFGVFSHGGSARVQVERTLGRSQDSLFFISSAQANGESEELRVLRNIHASRLPKPARPTSFRRFCAIPVVMLAPLRSRSSSLIFSNPHLVEDPAWITRGSLGWDWRRVPGGKATAMFLRGFVHVPDPEFDRCLGSSSAVSSTLQAKSAALNSSFTSRDLHGVVEQFSVGSSGKDESMKALQVYQTKARAHVVLVPALLVTIVGFLGSLHRNSHLLAIYVVAATLFVLLPFAIPALCISPETTIKHVRAAPRAVGVLDQEMGAILAAPSTTKCGQGPCNK
ncbi:hypothetical protein MRX96_041417, partial [Rhipicephalus microplus]